MTKILRVACTFPDFLLHIYSPPPTADTNNDLHVEMGGGYEGIDVMCPHQLVSPETLTAIHSLNGRYPSEDHSSADRRSDCECCLWQLLIPLRRTRCNSVPSLHVLSTPPPPTFLPPASCRRCSGRHGRAGACHGAAEARLVRPPHRSAVRRSVVAAEPRGGRQRGAGEWQGSGFRVVGDLGLEW